MKKTLSSRRFIVIGLFITVGIIFAIRLLFLQVFNDTYSQLARQNALRNIVQYPARGLIYDRNGKLLVYNELVYDLMVIPRQVRNIDTVLFCELVGISKEEFISKMESARKYSTYAPSIFEKQISKKDFGPIQEKLYQFPGFYSQNRTLRYYPKALASHVLGYIGEVNDDIIQNNPYYRSGDYIGISGLEKYYEEELRGKKGNKVTLVDAHNRVKGSFQEGRFDSAAVAGHNLYSTLDIELQEYAEKIMENKRGSIVAIEPSTGEVLCFVSAPFYDPNLLVGRVRGENYGKLIRDPGQPLFNRALMAQYPPGSIFKVPQAIIALDLGAISPNTAFPCDRSVVRCHNHPTVSSVRDAIKVSCNPYFYRVYQKVIMQKTSSGKTDSKLGLAMWTREMKKMGFGVKLDIDLPNILPGYIPDTNFYNRWYKGQWNFFTIYSNSIGQGEVEVIPLQMANFAAIVANRGWYISPHLVRHFGDENQRFRNTKYQRKNLTMVSKYYWEAAAEGMWAVVHEGGGTARRARIDDIAICGKTGTAENIGADHSVFICFAPKDDPKIAISVYIENAAGGGGSWAAPIASLIAEKYIRGEVLRKEVEKIYMEAQPCQPLPLRRKPKK